MRYVVSVHGMKVKKVWGVGMVMGTGMSKGKGMSMDRKRDGTVTGQQKAGSGIFLSPRSARSEISLNK